MISVKKEWEDAADNDEALLDWAKKWGCLLMEDFQNPIWTAGYTQGQKELLSLLRGLKMGNPTNGVLPEELREYASAIEVVQKHLRFISYNMIAEPEVAQNITEEQLLKIASDQIAPVIGEYIEIDAEELKDGKINFTFNLVLVK